jgi:ketosteroid isomerase-like protein
MSWRILAYSALAAATLPLPSLALTAGREASVPPPDLARAVRNYNEATIHKDIGALSELMTGNYMLVNSDASVQGKESYLADFRKPDFTLDPYAMEQPFYRVHGNTALTGWLFHLTWTQDGKRQARHLRIVHSWVKRSGRWRIEYTQLTRVPE